MQKQSFAYTCPPEEAECKNAPSNTEGAQFALSKYFAFPSAGAKLYPAARDLLSSVKQLLNYSTTNRDMSSVF